MPRASFAAPEATAGSFSKKTAKKIIAHHVSAAQYFSFDVFIFIISHSSLRRHYIICGRALIYYIFVFSVVFGEEEFAW